MRRVTLRVKGRIDPTWSEWFSGLEVAHCGEVDETVLSGNLPDQAALYGLLGKLRDLSLALLSVESEDADLADRP